MIKIYSQSRQILSDTITPIGTFLNLRDYYASTSLFESSDYHSKANSKSFIGSESLVTISVLNGELKIRTENSIVVERSISNGGELNESFEYFQFENKELAALNGFFGLFAYDSVSFFEEIELNSNQELPEVHFVIYRYVVVFDNFKNTATIVENSLTKTFKGLSDFEMMISKGQNYLSSFDCVGAVDGNMSDEEFARKIEGAKKYVAEGEVFQLVLSRKFYQAFQGDDFEVYRQLRALNPSPYMFYFNLEKARLFGASPEAQFKLSDGIAEINPIAGTAKRTGNVAVDNELAQQLAADTKENAEHTMLVDLARNDLNKFCTDVNPVKLKEIQEFSHVLHMVSKVQGSIRNARPLDAFGGAFPAGTLSGAPKYRAMQLIDREEKDPRNYYGGAIGHYAANGDMNFAIVIRSCLSRDGILEYQAGAGIVMDSEVNKEIEEVYNKAQVINRAIELANSQRADAEKSERNENCITR